VFKALLTREVVDGSKQNKQVYGQFSLNK